MSISVQISTSRLIGTDITYTLISLIIWVLLAVPNLLSAKLPRPYPEYLWRTQYVCVVTLELITDLRHHMGTYLELRTKLQTNAGEITPSGRSAQSRLTLIHSC